MDLQELEALFAGHHTVEWAQMPDLDLYMDQVVTYAQKQLELFQSAQGEKLVTPAILSNYVKSGLVPRPVQKRYGKEHLATFLMVCTLKQVFSIQQTQDLLKDQPEQESFALFAQLQDEAFQRMAGQLEKMADSEEETRHQIMRLALEANVNRLAAQLLLKKLGGGAAPSTPA